MSARLKHYVSTTNQSCGRDAHHPLQVLTFIDEHSTDDWQIDMIFELPRLLRVEEFADALFSSFVRPRHCEHLDIGLLGLEEQELEQLLSTLPAVNADIANCRRTSRLRERASRKQPFRPIKYAEHYRGDQILFRTLRSIRK